MSAAEWSFTDRTRLAIALRSPAGIHKGASDQPAPFPITAISKFRAHAFQAAVKKARELGWIV